MIKNLLKGKSKEEIITEILESKEDFMNKEFLKMIVLIHPKKLDRVLNAINASTQYRYFDACEYAAALWRGERIGPFHGIVSLKSALFLLGLAGIQKHLMNISINKSNKPQDPFFYLKLSKVITFE